MLTTFRKSILLSSSLLLPVGVMADLSKQDELKITKLCTTAISKKGYEGYNYKYIDLLRSQSENYAMMGQLHKEGTEPYEFNCFLNTKIKALKIVELVIEPLNPVAETNTSKASNFKD